MIGEQPCMVLEVSGMPRVFLVEREAQESLCQSVSREEMLMSTITQSYHCAMALYKNTVLCGKIKPILRNQREERGYTAHIINGNIIIG